VDPNALSALEELAMAMMLTGTGTELEAFWSTFSPSGLCYLKWLMLGLLHPWGAAPLAEKQTNNNNNYLWLGTSLPVMGRVHGSIA